MKKLTLTLLVASFSASAIAAHSNVPTPDVMKEHYGVNKIDSSILEGVRFTIGGVYVDKLDFNSNFAGFSLEVGADVNEYIGTSIKYTDAKNNNSKQGYDFESVAVGFDIGKTLTTSNQNSVKPYVSTGFGRINGEEDAFYYGVGVRAVNTDKVVISIEYKLSQTNDIDFGTTSASIGYKF